MVPDGIPRRLPAFGLSTASRAASRHGLPARLSALDSRLWGLPAFGPLGFRGEISRLKVVTSPRAQSREPKAGRGRAEVRHGRFFASSADIS